MYTGNMNKDLKVLLPIAVATSVSWDHAYKLTEIAERIYKHNESWGRKITDTTKGRDTLYAFMKHWFEGFQKSGKWIGER